MRMGKRLVVCCDGTWRRLEGASLTNIGRIACAVAPRDADGNPQLVAHVDGVGTGRGGGRLAKAFDRTIGGAFGSGLDDTLAEAYRFLVLNYEPGDEIVIFGYSRGAFTARSLAGLVRKCGVLTRENAKWIARALDFYRDAEIKPDAPESFDFRARHAPHVVVDTEEAAWRNTRLGGDWSGTQVLTIAYVGVFDTVGALGVPSLFGETPLFSRRHRFHDLKLSSHVAAARHAVAIDERRRAFKPTLWANLATLNGPASGRDAPYQQRWFPGVHGAVGGGGTDTGLSSHALWWLLEGVPQLALCAGERARIADERNALGPLAPFPRPDPLAEALRRAMERERCGPAAEDGTDALSEAARERWRNAAPPYRPRTLRRLAPLLDAP